MEGTHSDPSESWKETTINTIANSWNLFLREYMKTEIYLEFLQETELSVVLTVCGQYMY